MYLLS